MKTTLATILIAMSLCLTAAAQDKPKVLNIEPGSDRGAPTAAITVAIDGIAVTAFWEGHTVFTNAPNLIVGDDVDARIDGKKLVVKTLDGKTIKMTIIRRERLQPTK